MHIKNRGEGQWAIIERRIEVNRKRQKRSFKRGEIESTEWGEAEKACHEKVGEVPSRSSQQSLLAESSRPVKTV